MQNVLKRQRMATLETLTYDQMLGFVGTTFHAAVDDRRIEIVLDKALKVMESEAARLKRNPFSLRFAGPAEPFLPQRTYTLQHETLGTLEIFLVPIGRTANGFIYEAVFT